jgi:hypothetical protein
MRPRPKADFAQPESRVGLAKGRLRPSSTGYGAELDPTTQISGFEEIETDELRSELGLVLCESPANQARLSAGRARQILSVLGSIEIAPVGLAEQEGCSRSAGLAWLRRHHCGGSLLPNCIINPVPVRSYAFLFGCSRARRPPGLAASGAPGGRAGPGYLRFCQNEFEFMNENSCARNHLRSNRGHILRDGGKSRPPDQSKSLFRATRARPAAAACLSLSSLIVLGVLAVMLGVLLGGLVGMMRGMQAVGMGDMRVMTGLFMLAAIIVLGRFAVMVGRALVVLGRRLVMLAAMVGLGAHVGRPVVGDLRREADASF